MDKNISRRSALKFVAAGVVASGVTSCSTLVASTKIIPVKRLSSQQQIIGKIPTIEFG